MLVVIERRRLEPARLAHTLTDEDARFAKLRLQTGRDLHDNPYSTVGPPPGCEGLTRSGLEPVQVQLAQRFPVRILLKGQRDFRMGGRAAVVVDTRSEGELELLEKSESIEREGFTPPVGNE